MNESSQGAESHDSTNIDCGQRPTEMSSWVSTRRRRGAGMLDPSDSRRTESLLEDDSMLDMRQSLEFEPSVEGGRSDESFMSDASFSTVTKAPKGTRVVTNNNAQLQNNSMCDQIFEVYIVSKTGLPKQFALAKALHSKAIKGVLKIKYKGPFKVLIQLSSREEAEKLLICKDFNNEDKRAYWSNETCCSYGVVKYVELEVDEQDFLKSIECQQEILMVRRLNRLDGGAMACCAFSGHISEIPNISVDNFTKNAQVYFLSHTHTDHTPGLYDPRFIQTWKNGAVMYMSEMSAAIVKYEVKCRLGGYDTDEILKQIRIIGIETIQVVLKADPKRRQKATTLYVTAIPAAHSFGSVMFLFKTDFTTVLYTGDFRISINDVSKFNQLHDNGVPITIDTLYIDTTFLNDRYKIFPKRSASVNAALDEIERWLKGRGRVAIKTSAKFGYEFVFNELFKRLGVKVFVEEVRWKELYSHLPHLVPGVTNEPSPVHLCWPKNRKDHTNCTPDSKNLCTPDSKNLCTADSKNLCTPDSKKLCTPDSNNYKDSKNLCTPDSKNYKCTVDSNHRYLNIHLSAQKWTNFDTDDNPICKVSEDDIDVCFSTHCSKSELMYFVNYFNPKKVVGFPNKFESDVNSVKSEILPKIAKLEDGKLDIKVLREIFDI